MQTRRYDDNLSVGIFRVKKHRIMKELLNRERDANMVVNNSTLDISSRLSSIATGDHTT